MTEQPYLGIALLTPNGEGARKGALKKAYLAQSRLVNHYQRLPPLRGQKLQRKLRLKLGTWNVRTLMDNENAKCKRPERRSAIVALELQKNDIDIAALSETRLADEGKLTEMGGGYTFFWKGKLKEEPRHHGVGFAIKNKLVNQLQ